MIAPTLARRGERRYGGRRHRRAWAQTTNALLTLLLAFPGESMTTTRRTPSRTLPRRMPRQPRARLTRDAIIEAAAHLLATRGWDASTTNHIAERAGVSIGSLYKYFPNKPSIL